MHLQVRWGGGHSHGRLWKRMLIAKLSVRLATNVLDVWPLTCIGYEFGHKRARGWGLATNLLRSLATNVLRHAREGPNVSSDNNV